MKQYLTDFHFLSKNDEESFFENQRRTCYSREYPFKINPEKGICDVKLGAITISTSGL